MTHFENDKRQFAFLSTDFTVTSDTSTTDSIHYHCFVKVCPLTDETTCSTKKLDNNPNTCAAPTYYDPAGRRSISTDQHWLKSPKQFLPNLLHQKTVIQLLMAHASYKKTKHQDHHRNTLQQLLFWLLSWLLSIYKNRIPGNSSKITQIDFANVFLIWYFHADANKNAREHVGKIKMNHTSIYISGISIRKEKIHNHVIVTLLLISKIKKKRNWYFTLTVPLRNIEFLFCSTAKKSSRRFHDVICLTSSSILYIF